MEKKLGFIGVGIMGKPMAKNLLNAGYSLVVNDIDPAPVRELVDLGAESADTPADVAAACSRVITMLPDGPDVEKVVAGDNGILKTATAETAMVDMSSISPTVTRKIVAALQQKGARALDAPVSGGEPGAVNGQLAIMVGGPGDLFEEMKPVFDVLGKSAVLVGDVGAGQTTKLVNQILVGIHIEAMGEAFVLAAKSGVDPVKVFDAIKGGLAGSNVLNAKIPMVVDRNFKPGFKIKLHRKDLDNALDAAEALGLDLPVTREVMHMVSSLVDDGYGEHDHGGIVQFVEQKNKVEITRK